MAKLTLTDLAAGPNIVSTINANHTLIETALENTLSRDGTTPNTMSAALDMNSNKIINLQAPTAASDAARLVDITGATALGSGILPAQANNYNRILRTDGSSLAWDELLADVSTITADPNIGTTNGNTHGYLVNAAIDIDLPDITESGEGAINWFKNIHASAVATITLGNTADDLDGTTNGTFYLRPGDSAAFLQDGNGDWWSFNVQRKLQFTRANISSSQTIANDTLAEISWTGEYEDDMGLISVTSTDFTIPSQAGITRIAISATIEWAANTTGYRLLELRRNGTPIQRHCPSSVIDAPSTSVVLPQFIAATVLETGDADVWSLAVRQNSGGNLDVNAGLRTAMTVTVLE